MSKNEDASPGRGVVRELRESAVDIVVVEGEGDDVFVKIGDQVSLVDAGEARTLGNEIDTKLRETVSVRLTEAEASLADSLLTDNEPPQFVRDEGLLDEYESLIWKLYEVNEDV